MLGNKKQQADNLAKFPFAKVQPYGPIDILKRDGVKQVIELVSLLSRGNGQFKGVKMGVNDELVRG